MAARNVASDAKKVATEARKAARAAAIRDAERRASFVGAAAETQEQIAALIADLAAAVEAHDATYAAAVREGWDKDQLKKWGVQEDPAGALRRALRRLVATDDAASVSLPKQVTPAEPEPATAPSVS